MYNFDSKHLIFINQAIVSIGNFISTILLIKFLGLEKFGIYSFFWIFLLLINSIQLSTIISPMLTNSSKKNINELKLYQGSTFLQQFFFSSFIFIVSCLFLKFFFNLFFPYDVSKYYIIFPLLIVSSQLFQFFRRLLIYKTFLLKIIIIDFLFYTSLIITFLFLNNLSNLNIEIIFKIYFILYCLSVIFFSPIIFDLKFSFNSFILSFRENWLIGKWLFLTSLIQWFSGNLWVVNVGVFLGSNYLGIVRACQTILGIVNPLFQSFENIYPKETSKIFKEKGYLTMNNFIQQKNLKYFILIMILSLIIFLNSERILSIFFTDDISKNYFLLGFLSFLLPLTSLQYFPQYGLRTLSKTFPIFLSYLLSSIFAIMFSPYMIKGFEMYGFIFGMYFSQIIIILVTYVGYIYFFKKLHNEN